MQRKTPTPFGSKLLRETQFFSLYSVKSQLPGDLIEIAEFRDHCADCGILAFPFRYQFRIFVFHHLPELVPCPKHLRRIGKACKHGLKIITNRFHLSYLLMNLSTTSLVNVHSSHFSL